jgi:hypothetical protein
MLIECASTRLNIDLLYSLKKNGYEPSQIRLSYIYDDGIIMFKTFNSLNLLESFYNTKYKYLIAARKNPFTTDKSKASYGKIAKNGEILSKELEPLKINKIEGLCKIGPFVGIESVKLTNSILGFELIYNCRDISDIFSIIPGRSFNLRKDNSRILDMNKYKNRIGKFIKDYQTIQKELYKSWNSNLYVDLCYVKVGYVEQSIKLYKIYFALVKERINSGLRLTVLNLRYLRRIDL